MAKEKTLIFGAGWIGGQFAERLDNAALTRADIADPNAVQSALAEFRPDVVINCAAKSGIPNIDSCEKDSAATLRSNRDGALTLAAACAARKIYFVHMSSGCIYDGAAGPRGFTEEDPPNFLGNVYARSKAEAEAGLKDYAFLALRIRMPFSEKPSPRNLLSKLIEYRRVVHQPNSVTILEDFFPAALGLIERRASGIFNVVNPGIEYHDEVLAAYREMIDPAYRYEVISMGDLQKRVLAPRSNCLLSTEKLQAMGLGLPPFAERLPSLLKAFDKARI